MTARKNKKIYCQYPLSKEEKPIPFMSRMGIVPDRRKSRLYLLCIAGLTKPEVKYRGYRGSIKIELILILLPLAFALAARDF